jgi:Outer membrane protein beta-barrel domain
MKGIYKTFILVFVLFYTEGVSAQARFKASALAGANFGQIDGDRQEGYRNRGVSLGLEGSVYLQPNTDISMQLMYNQKGARPNPDDKGSQLITLNTISLNYSEIGLIINHHYKPNSTRTYYTQSLFAGLSYGRLLQSSTSIIKKNVPVEILEKEVATNLNPHDFSFMVGWSQLFTPRVGASFRFTRSINLLYNNPNFTEPSNGMDFKQLRPYFISLHGFYNLVSPNKTMGLKSKKQKEQSNPLEELY